ncbi:MAG TPA: hypothetical protein VF292_16345 [Rhodanobacteraceae bacterium]
MAHIELEHDCVAVRLNWVDKVLALHGSLGIPYDHITSVAHTPVPQDWFRGVRIGTNLPGVKVAGTFFTVDGRIFYDFSDASRCLVFGLEHERYTHVVVQVDAEQDPADLAQRIVTRLDG